MAFNPMDDLEPESFLSAVGGEIDEPGRKTMSFLEHANTALKPIENNRQTLP